MKKYIFLTLNLYTMLGGMEVPKAQPLCTFSESFDMWEFFAEPNKLDSLTGPIPCWDENNYKSNCSIDTVAYLHILQNSNLATNNLKIFDTTCKKGHTSAFLAQEAKFVHAYDEDGDNLLHATLSNSINNLRFIKKGDTHSNYYDLIIGCSPAINIERLKQLHAILAPGGKIFCSLVTQSNPPTIAAMALQEILPKICKHSDYYSSYNSQNYETIEDRKYPTDETLQHMIQEAQFKIISYTQISFDILILDKNKFRDFHRSIILYSPAMKKISDIRKRETIAGQFVDKIISKIKKDNLGCWFYPINTTIIHLCKND